MNPYRLACLAAVSLFVAAAFVSLPTDGRSGPMDERSDVLRPEAERERIRAHLLGAERILRAADVSHLGEAQREGRARAIALLREYRLAGVFPHNHDFPGERRPYFVDRHGTLCAMAYLIARTGGEDLVARVARTANNASVPELAGDPAFGAWLDRHGMTVAEAARVQPWYGCCLEGPGADESDTDYALATAGNAMLGGAAIALQLTDGGAPDTWRSILGLAAGGVGLGLGAVRLQGTSEDEELAALNLGLGAAALGTVAWRVLRGDDAPAPVAGEEAGPELSWSAGPALGREGGAGVQLTLRF